MRKEVFAVNKGYTKCINEHYYVVSKNKECPFCKKYAENIKSRRSNLIKFEFPNTSTNVEEESIDRTILDNITIAKTELASNSDYTKTELALYEDITRTELAFDDDNSRTELALEDDQ